MANLYQKNYPIDKDYPDLYNYHNSMSKALTPEMYAKYRDVVTQSGFTFDKVIQPGVDNPGHPSIPTAGCVAGDAECYTLFKEFFDAVIEQRHGGYPMNAKQAVDHDASKLTEGHLDSDYVLCCRVRTGRSIEGLPLPPHCNRMERREVERIITDALACLPEHFAGRYHSLRSLSQHKELQKELLASHILFDKPQSPILLSSGIARDWPDARGVFYNADKDFVVWVNEEDHMRVLSLAKGGNMTAVFQRFSDGMDKIEAALVSKNHRFIWNDHLGYILSCPSNLGTGLRASVHVRLPQLCAQDEQLFSDILYKLRLVRRTLHEQFELSEGVCDISNADRLGISKVDLVQILVDGVRLLIEMEKKLAAGESIDALIPTEQVMKVNSHALFARNHVTDDNYTLENRVSFIGAAQSMQELLPQEATNMSIQAEEAEI